MTGYGIPMKDRPLCQWGVEGETYTVDDDGNIVLNSDIYYNGLNPGAEKQLNVDYGFGNGVFAYGGSDKSAAASGIVMK